MKSQSASEIFLGNNPGAEFYCCPDVPSSHLVFQCGTSKLCKMWANIRLCWKNQEEPASALLVLHFLHTLFAHWLHRWRQTDARLCKAAFKPWWRKPAWAFFGGFHPCHACERWKIVDLCAKIWLNFSLIGKTNKSSIGFCCPIFFGGLHACRIRDRCQIVETKIDYNAWP